jgi:hypothetical protein
MIMRYLRACSPMNGEQRPPIERRGTSRDELLGDLAVYQRCADRLAQRFDVTGWHAGRPDQAVPDADVVLRIARCRQRLDIVGAGRIDTEHYRRRSQELNWREVLLYVVGRRHRERRINRMRADGREQPLMKYPYVVIAAFLPFKIDILGFRKEEKSDQEGHPSYHDRIPKPGVDVAVGSD